MPADPVAAKAVFLDAVALADPAARAALVDARCGGDAALRGRVEALLAAGDRATELAGAASLGAGGGGDAGGPPAARPGPAEAAGTVVAGRYTLVEPVGEGGMGTVWWADQTEPVRRAVAVKLIKAGMDSKRVLARFEAERQALAVMDHPHIAKVLDGGVHAGRPFFVMELVDGVPITDYCDARRLTPRQRLELFVPVCEAIQHAHQKGIIHRDIKPSNVLVAEADGRPVPKVIDFGVAEATGGALTEHTLDTGLGGVVGTPAYMSPEQATLGNPDVDTRSDVYALGVLLYELLAGSPPFPPKELDRKGLLEVLRVVREEVPPRPSAKLSSAAGLPGLSASRGTEPRTLTGLLRSELDWVVMKALEKDPGRRYETATGFAADVRRYLGGEAVHAHPPGAGYRLRKFVRRNRGRVAAAGLVLAAVLAGVAGTAAGLVEARTQERAAAARRAEADRADGERLARLEADARRYARVGQYDRSLPLAEEALRLARDRLGDRHFNTLMAMQVLATDYRAVERHDQSVPLAEECYRLMRATLGDADPWTAETKNELFLCRNHALFHEIRGGRPLTVLPKLAALFEERPGDASLYMNVPPLQLWFGQEREYVATRRRLLAAAAGTTNPHLAGGAAKVCSLAPSPDPAEREAALALARTAVGSTIFAPDHVAWNLLHLGMAEYRAGHLDAAVTTLQDADRTARATPNPLRRGIAGFYRAMSLFRLGQADEARTLAAATAAAMRPLPADPADPRGGGADFDDLVVWLAYKEARSLIGFTAADPPPKAKQTTYYFPTAVGDRAVFAVDRDGTRSERTMCVLSVERAGEILRVSTGRDHRADALYEVSERGVTLVAGLAGGDPPGLPLLKLPAADGPTWEVSEAADKARRTSFRVAKEAESVTVPAGTYMAVRVDATETAGGKPTRWTVWYAPGIGPVKSVEEGGGSKRTEVLQSFTPKR